MALRQLSMSTYYITTESFVTALLASTEQAIVAMVSFEENKIGSNKLVSLFSNWRVPLHKNWKSLINHNQNEFRNQKRYKTCFSLLAFLSFSLGPPSRPQ